MIHCLVIITKLNLPKASFLNSNINSISPKPKPTQFHSTHLHHQHFHHQHDDLVHLTLAVLLLPLNIGRAQVHSLSPVQLGSNLTNRQNVSKCTKPIFLINSQSRESLGSKCWGPKYFHQFSCWILRKYNFSPFFYTPASSPYQICSCKHK